MADNATPLALPPAGPLAGAAWGLLGLTGALAVYFGLSAVALPFLGEPGYAKGIDRWVGPMVGLQQFACSLILFRALSRRQMGTAVGAVAFILILGWFGLLPAAARDGLGFGPEARLVTVFLLAAPVLAGFGLTLCRTRPVAAALVVTLPTTAGVLGVLALAGMIAVWRF